MAHVAKVPGPRVVLDGDLTIEPLSVEVHERAIALMLMSRRDSLERAERAIDGLSDLVVSGRSYDAGVRYDHAIHNYLADHQRFTEAAESSLRAIAKHRWALAQLNHGDN